MCSVLTDQYGSHRPLRVTEPEIKTSLAMSEQPATRAGVFEGGEGTSSLQSSGQGRQQGRGKKDPERRGWSRSEDHSGAR